MAEENLVPDDEPKSTIPDAVVTIEEPKVTEVEPKTTVTPVARSTRDAAEEGVEALTKNLEAEKKRAETAERNVASERAARQAAEASATAAQSKITAQMQQNIDANRSAATNALEAAKARRDQAKKDFIALQAEGKFDEAFEATQRAAEATTEIKGAEGYLTNLDAAVARMEAEPAPKPVDDGLTDPVTKIKFTPETFAWVEKHKENWKDADFRIECDAAARQAKKKGLQPDTTEYFEYVEQRLQREGYLEMPDDQPAESEPKPKIAAKKPSGASMGAAPSRAVPGTTGVPKNGVKLSGMEREIARSLVESLPEVYGKGSNPDQIYARNKMAIQQEEGE